MTAIGSPCGATGASDSEANTLCWPPIASAQGASRVRERYLAYLEQGVDGDDAAALAEEDQLAADLQAYIDSHIAG